MSKQLTKYYLYLPVIQNLPKISLNENQIGYEWVKAIADALRVNTFLKEIYLINYKIGNYGG
jgi:hypothetical protein